MLRRLKSSLSFTAERGKKDKLSPAPEQLEPRLPLELLFKIVANYDTESPMREDTLALANIGSTCRTLRNHCRPLLFHTVSLQSYPVGTRFSTVDQNDPRSIGGVEAFSKLIKKSPDPIQSFVRTLNLEYRLAIPPETNLAQLANIHNLPKSAWQRVLGGPYANLTTLRLFWDQIPPYMLDAVVGMLQGLMLQRLETLEVECSVLPIPFLYYVPPTVKTLSLRHGTIAYESLGVPHPPPDRDVTHPPRPHALSLQIQRLEAPLEPLTQQKILDLTALKHIHLEHIRDHVSHHIHNTFIYPSSHTIQCVHLNSARGEFHNAEGGGLPGGASASGVPPRPGLLDINALVSLQCLEVITWGYESALAETLQWISFSMQTVPEVQQAERFKNLRINVLLRHSSATVAEAAEAWKEVHRGWDWPVLYRAARVAGFMLHQQIDSHWEPTLIMPRTNFPPIPLDRGCTGGEEIVDVLTLWKSPYCPGWL
ncbi:hypothetical protein BKA70DRAFT_1263297 [Coprinopsis sp. MPI-PUGE-AT-0042]|nr:hypothetical protein BKA70DRAFT_1263297 [Coprinopsis sp. MPI-PUGE-AT-0042]